MDRRQALKLMGSNVALPMLWRLGNAQSSLLEELVTHPELGRLVNTKALADPAAIKEPEKQSYLDTVVHELDKATDKLELPKLSAFIKRIPVVYSDDGKKAAMGQLDILLKAGYPWSSSVTQGTFSGSLREYREAITTEKNVLDFFGEATMVTPFSAVVMGKKVLVGIYCLPKEYTIFTEGSQQGTKDRPNGPYLRKRILVSHLLHEIYHAVLLYEGMPHGTGNEEVMKTVSESNAIAFQKQALADVGRDVWKESGSIFEQEIAQKIKKLGDKVDSKLLLSYRD